MRIDNLTLNLADHTVHRGNDKIELSTRELTLLKVLMREPGRVFTRTELCERVWEREHEYDTKRRWKSSSAACAKKSGNLL